MTTGPTNVKSELMASPGFGAELELRLCCCIMAQPDGSLGPSSAQLHTQSRCDVGLLLALCMAGDSKNGWRHIWLSPRPEPGCAGGKP